MKNLLPLLTLEEEASLKEKIDQSIKEGASPEQLSILVQEAIKNSSLQTEESKLVEQKRREKLSRVLKRSLPV